MTEADLKSGKMTLIERQVGKVGDKIRKTAGHDLRKEEGKKSREDFKGEVFRILKTSEGVTDGRV